MDRMAAGASPVSRASILLKLTFCTAQMMLAGVLLGLVIFFTRETRGNVILSRRARKLRKATGDERYQCRSDAERASMVVLMKVSMTRPLCESCGRLAVPD